MRASKAVTPLERRKGFLYVACAAVVLDSEQAAHDGAGAYLASEALVRRAPAP